MLFRNVSLSKRNGDDAEKPFWISFADLMTALMVMFLLVMSVALLAVTKTVSEAEQKKQQRDDEIQQLLAQVENASRAHGITVDKSRNVIDFGDQANFEFGKSDIDQEKAKKLHQFVPDLLKIAQDQLGEKWLKRVVVEGYTDKAGTYLYNLNLSLQRSQRVLCVLLNPSADVQSSLSVVQKQQIKQLFLVGGYSSNSSKESADASRRIEFRLEFFGLDEDHRRPDIDQSEADFGRCSI